MFKGIYNVYSENLQYSAVKIISMLSKNRAQQSYLILNYGGFCENFSQNARNIHAESITVREFFTPDIQCIQVRLRSAKLMRALFCPHWHEQSIHSTSAARNFPTAMLLHSPYRAYRKIIP